MTADESSTETEASLPDEPAVREALDQSARSTIADVVADHPDSPLAWTELADLADSEGRTIESFAYATVAAELSREQLVAVGWQPGDAVPWADEANRAYLRALDTERRAAEHLGLADRAARLEAELTAADSGAQARIASEFTPTQVISVVPEMYRPAAPASVPAPDAAAPDAGPAPDPEPADAAPSPAAPDPEPDPEPVDETAAPDAARED